MPKDSAARARRGPDTVEILRLGIRLDRVEPAVIRTVDLRASSSLATLHGAIQCAMGWYDRHLHEFVKDGVRYGPESPFDDFGDEPLESERKRLGTLFRTGSDSLTYWYDFGDDWYHTVTLLERLPPDLQMRRPRCVAGENACPPEDVGGPFGYADYVDAVRDPSHPDHDALVEWGGPDFDPRRFDVTEAEARLEEWFGRR